MGINVRHLVLAGIKDYCYSFVPEKYSFTKPTRLVLDWIFEANKLTGRQEYYINDAITVMMEKGLICEDKYFGFKLTPKGEAELDRLEVLNYEIPRPRVWDQKYRVIVFDISEQKRRIRDELRNWLIRLGFVRLQNSVWVFPYECEEIVELIKANYGVIGEVLYMTVESIENSQWLKKQFGLD